MKKYVLGVDYAIEDYSVVLTKDGWKKLSSLKSRMPKFKGIVTAFHRWSLLDRRRWPRQPRSKS